jgi:tetratricopeptide (TPR) repeat protein
MAELGAVIGRAFDVHLLAQASQRDEVDVAKALDELWRRKIARNPDAKRYDFSHDRIRDVAYAEIGPAKQTLLHGCVAQALQAVHGNQLESVYGELAEHQLRAGNLVQALANFRAAAATAKALLAHVELVRYLEKAIAVTHLDTHNDSFRSAEIDVWIDLSFARVRIYDFASDPVYQASLTANKLASQFGSASQKSQAFQALGVVTRNRGQWRDARRYDDLMLPLVNHEGNLETAGHMVGLYGITLYHFGEFESARGYLEQSLKLHDRSISIKPWEPGSPPRPNLLRMAKCLWMLGFPDQACACCDEAVQIASGYPATSWGTRDFGAMLGIYMRDVERVDALSQTMLELSNKYEFPFYQRAARMFQGWVMAQRGDAATGAMWVRDAVDHHRNLGIRMFEPFWRAVLAEALISAGKIEDALCEINEAIAYSETCGNTYWTGHLLTLKGDCLLTLTGSASSAEVWYQQALDLTQTQKAKSLELRAATKLARLWQSQDRVAQARQLLAPIYNWFTEGFGTPDLVEAKALLDELA